MDIFEEMERDATSGEFKKAPTDAESSAITELGLELVKIEKRLVAYEVVKRELEARKAELQFRLLPDAMEAIRQDVIGLPDDDVDLRLEDYFKAGLPNPDSDSKATPEERARKAELRAEGLAFLAEDAPDILTTELVVKLPKGNLELAKLMRTTLIVIFGSDATPGGREFYLMGGTDADGVEQPGLLRTLAERNEPGFDASRAGIEEGVHWGTLTSYVKEQIRERKRSDLPLEALGATVGRIVKIVKRKKSK